jgi:hypothetical protein
MGVHVDDLVFLCELCGQIVGPGDRAARILAETCLSDGCGGAIRTEADEEVVLAVFHAACVAETRQHIGCDVVPYVEEAREVVPGESSDRRPRFVVYRGGLA